MIPTKILPRLTDGLKKFQPILKIAKSKDINESDTVVIITDILSELFGFDKYSEITSEYAIKKTFCDLAIKISNEICFLIEVKAIGIELRSDHIKQAVDYGSNAGVDWVILTNGIQWKIFKIIFAKPVYNDLVYEFNLLDLSPKKDSDLDLLFMVSKESLTKSVLQDYHSKKLALSKYFIANLLTTEPVVEILRKTIKKMNPDIKIENEAILDVLVNDVIKRETFDGDKADEAKKKILKFMTSQQRTKEEKPIVVEKPDPLITN